MTRSKDYHAKKYLNAVLIIKAVEAVLELLPEDDQKEIRKGT